jgi:hypothetical protein
MQQANTLGTLQLSFHNTVQEKWRSSSLAVTKIVWSVFVFWGILLGVVYLMWFLSFYLVICCCFVDMWVAQVFLLYNVVSEFPNGVMLKHLRKHKILIGIRGINVK